MKKRLARYAAMLTTAGICLVFPGSLMAQGPAAAPQPQGQEKNRTLLAAASPFEDLIDDALGNNRQGMEKALRQYEGQKATVQMALSPEKQQAIISRVNSIRKAISQGDNQTAAQQAVEGYRLLIEALDASRLQVPVQVQMLDYAGFKTKILLHAQSPDWQQIQSVATGAQQEWTAIRPRVADEALQDAMDTTVAGLQDASAGNNPGMAALAAAMDLALVDLLERSFEPPK